MSLTVHAVLDYLVAVTLAWAGFFWLGANTDLGLVAVWLAGLVFALQVFTDGPLGLIRWIPPRVHAVLELPLAFTVMVWPRFHHAMDDTPRAAFFLALGALMIVFALATRWSKFGDYAE